MWRPTTLGEVSPTRLLQLYEALGSGRNLAFLTLADTVLKKVQLNSIISNSVVSRYLELMLIPRGVAPLVYFRLRYFK